MIVDRVAELLADLRDVHVDGARVAEPVVAPHAVEDLLAGEREPGPLGEEAQQVELLGRELDRLVGDRGPRADRCRWSPSPACTTSGAGPPSTRRSTAFTRATSSAGENGLVR